ncbi:MAG TPA: serine/threonine-protein kinase [Phycisphaerae bacterium]|nr:serine/threonine-protein kinase [Phycisphaerae bacterium]
MITRLKCSLGHTWEPADVTSAPLVCPTCGRPPIPGGDDPDQTVDTDPDRTVDLPTPTPQPTRSTAANLPSPSEVTQTMHFTPLPRPPTTETSTTRSRPDSTAKPQDSRLKTQDAGGGGGGFTIIRQHARGGLGLVNLARDEAIKREVALKQILPQHADNPTLKRRFLYEAQITGQLEHPSIVPVYTLGYDDTGSPYYIMRFVRGRTLDAIIVEHHASPNPIVFRELLRRFIAVCQAVAYAHSRGVIHRDLKPSNVMLGDYGETLVLDWGLAKDIKNKTDPLLEKSEVRSQKSDSRTSDSRLLTPDFSANSELTLEGQIIGTPAYMAPEQAEGRTELHGPVTDIYALGGILYKILCGQSPQAPTASSAGSRTGQRRLIFIESQPPSKFNKEIDPLLEKLCLRAMATDPAARYQRALELAQDIQRWLDEHPLSIRPATAAARFRRFLANHLVLVFSLMALLIALLVALLFIK